MRTSALVLATALIFVHASCSPPPGDETGDAGGMAGGGTGPIGGTGTGGTAVAGQGGASGTSASGAGGTASGSGGTSGAGGASGGSISTGGSGLGGAGAGSGGAPGGAGAGGISGGGAGGAGGSLVGGAGMGGGGKGGAAGSAGKGGAGGAGGAAAGAGGSGGGGAFAPCPASGACRILPLGDSITDGFNVAGGYRVELFSLALENDKEITFVGGSMNGPQMVDGVTFPRSHEGHSGWTISQIDGIVPTPALGTSVNPHIILLHIGTNDMNGQASGATTRLGTLLDGIISAAPNALLVVSNIIPFPGRANDVMTYNAAVPGIVQMRKDAGKHVLFVDQFMGFPNNELADGVHPNANGYARMARAWYAAISSYLP